MEAIKVDGISKRFGALLAVDNVSFTVESGQTSSACWGAGTARARAR